MGLCVVTCLLMAAALYLIFWHRPLHLGADLVQRMAYVYVPAVWVSGVAFVLVMLTSVGYLLTTQAVWYSRASAMAEVGFVFCSVTAITGVLRGKALTNQWWNADMVLAMMLVLWGLLTVYLGLRRYAVTQAARKWLAGLGVLMCFSVPLCYAALTRILPMQKVEMVVRQYADFGFHVLLTLMASIAGFFLLFWYLVQQRVSLDVMATELEHVRQTLLRQIMPEQTRPKDRLLVENQNFIIEGYSFTESQQND